MFSIQQQEKDPIVVNKIPSPRIKVPNISGLIMKIPEKVEDPISRRVQQMLMKQI